MPFYANAVLEKARKQAQEKLAAEEAARKAEEERLAREKAEREEAERKAEEERVAKEKAEKERLAKEKLELEAKAQKILENESAYSLEELLGVEKVSHNAQIQFFISERYNKQKKYDKSFEWAKKSAEQKNYDGLARFGWHYLFGNGVEKDVLKGSELIHESIKFGQSSYGQNTLGYMYENGIDVERNYSDALFWYKKAAEQGNANAQVNLGRMYKDGLGVERNYSEAFSWFKKSAEQGNSNAQFFLGLLYMDGFGVEQNYTEAFSWYKKSAEQGVAGAQCNLGLLYEEGKGVAQNYTEAFRWYKKSAEQGNSIAQSNLGLLYEEGKGVEQNKEKAIYWYEKAAEQGNKKAIERLELLNQSVPVTSPVEGAIFKYTVPEGAFVSPDKTVAIIESMKMEIEVKARSAGTIHFITPCGKCISSGEKIATISPSNSSGIDVDSFDLGI